MGNAGGSPKLSTCDQISALNRQLLHGVLRFANKSGAELKERLLRDLTYILPDTLCTCTAKGQAND